jgi:hypothetical protein
MTQDSQKSQAQAKEQKTSALKLPPQFKILDHLSSGFIAAGAGGLTAAFLEGLFHGFSTKTQPIVTLEQAVIIGSISIAALVVGLFVASKVKEKEEEMAGRQKSDEESYL